MGIVAWHGSHRWEGRPEIRDCKKGNYEHGPGIYNTTRLSTASRYAKGGGRILRVEMFADIGWLEDARLPIDQVIGFVRNSSRIRKKKVLEADILQCLGRREGMIDTGLMPANFLVNLAVNNECLSGAGGPELAEFLAGNGIHASLHSKSSEDWIVVFDPEAITNVEVLSAKDIDWANDAVPGVKEQIAALAAEAERSSPSVNAFR